MANHVTTRMWIVEGNESAYAVIEAFNEKHREMADKWQHQVPLFALWEDTQKLYDDEKWSELHDEIGSKWCYIFDWDSDGVSFESAWGYPQGVCLRVAKMIMDADPNAIVAMTYEDEMPNFIGCCVYADGDHYDEEYIDSDAYKALNLRFWWDEEEEGEEEPDDWERTYEEAYNLLDEYINDMVLCVKSDREESE